MTRTPEDVAGVPERISRADLILACIPICFVGGYGIGALLFGTWSAATASGSVACWPPMAEGLFRHPPRGADRADR